MDVECLALKAVHEKRAGQKPYELAALGRLALGYRCRDALEIGTCFGGTAWFLAELGFKVTTVDIAPQVEHPRADVTYVVADSRVFKPIPCDLLFIDGAHDYAGVVADWRRFSPLVRPGGLVAFHDIVVHDPPQLTEVDVFWRELKLAWRTLEIVDPRGGSWGGIGVLMDGQA